MPLPDEIVNLLKRIYAFHGKEKVRVVDDEPVEALARVLLEMVECLYPSTNNQHRVNKPLYLVTGRAVMDLYSEYLRRSKLARNAAITNE